MNEYMICYRVLNSTETDWDKFTARDRDEAMWTFRQRNPYNMVLAVYENKERI